MLKFNIKKNSESWEILKNRAKWSRGFATSVSGLIGSSLGSALQKKINHFASSFPKPFFWFYNEIHMKASAADIFQAIGITSNSKQICHISCPIGKAWCAFVLKEQTVTWEACDAFSLWARLHILVPYPLPIQREWWRPELITIFTEMVKWPCIKSSTLKSLWHKKTLDISYWLRLPSSIFVSMCSWGK